MIIALWALAGFFSLSATRIEAHNGAVAVAYLVTGIVVDGDGDLSDWLEDVDRYPIVRSNFGEPVEADRGWGRLTGNMTRRGWVLA